MENKAKQQRILQIITVVAALVLLNRKKKETDEA